mmetsp:Transcript_42332/g.120694  ORF Transcript_42332/g.120694 Transcript_42332/m.120694 type:complete len:248 (-) Transcript_42332:529-1272(-)
MWARCSSQRFWSFSAILSSSSRLRAPFCTSCPNMSWPSSFPSKTRSASFLAVLAPRSPQTTSLITSLSTTPARNSSIPGSPKPSPRASSSSASLVSAASVRPCSTLQTSARLFAWASSSWPQRRFALPKLSLDRSRCCIASVSSDLSWLVLECSYRSRLMEGVAGKANLVTFSASSQSSLLTCRVAKQRKGGRVRSCSCIQETSLPPVGAQPVKSSKACVSVSFPRCTGMQRKGLLAASWLRGYPIT